MAGTFDVDNFGDALFPHVIRHELGRRLPGSEIVALSPMGRPTAWDRGERSEAIGPLTERRLDVLAERFDCLLVGGGDIIHTRFERIAPCYRVGDEEIRTLELDRFFIEGLGPEREAECPVVWNGVGVPFDLAPAEEARVGKALAGRPYTSVRDRISASRVEAAGVGEVEVVPDPSVLMGRLFPLEIRERRLRHVRALGWYPDHGAPLILQGNAGLQPFLPELLQGVRSILAQRPDLVPVTVSLGPCHGDGSVAEAMAAGLGQKVWRVPEEAALEDLVAVIAGSAGFVGSSLHGNIAAFMHDVPGVILDLNQHSKHEGFAAMAGDPGMLVRDGGDLPEAFLAQTRRNRTDDIERILLRADDHFDMLARIAADAAAARTGRPRSIPAEERVQELERELTLLRRAYEVRGRRLATDAATFADRIQAQRLPMKKAELFFRSRSYRYLSWLGALYRGLTRPFRKR